MPSPTKTRYETSVSWRGAPRPNSGIRGGLTGSLRPTSGERGAVLWQPTTSTPAPAMIVVVIARMTGFIPTITASRVPNWGYWQLLRPLGAIASPRQALPVPHSVAGPVRLQSWPRSVLPAHCVWHELDVMLPFADT